MEPKDKILKIEWQRLVYKGQTCPRCQTTEEELNKAINYLHSILLSQGIKIVLEKREVSSEEFQKNPLQSNRIIINGKLLEEYINGKEGKSPCCDICGPNDCRTIVVNNHIVYEQIPAELIINACLKAIDNIISPIRPIQP